MSPSLSSLSLFPADEEQTIESRTRTFAAWGSGTTLEQYLQRDALTDIHEVSKDDRLVTWVLARRDSPESLDFLCSCETFRRVGLVARASTDADGQNVVTGVNCYGIASLFTPEKNRGKGYARHLMQLLHWIIGRRTSLPLDQFPAEWGAPPARPSFVEDGEFSVLFSDVGPKIYLSTGPTSAGGDGWRVTEPTSTLWEVCRTHTWLSSANTGSLDWRWLDANSVIDAFEADAHAIKRELAENPISRPTAFTHLPTHGVAEFQTLRLEQFWNHINPVPTHWGISANNASDSSAVDVSTFASWTIDYRPPVMNRLIITRLRSSPEHFEALLFQIIDFAKRHSVDEVEVWGLPHHLKDIAQHSEGRTFDRDEHLPSFKWYGPGDAKDVSWAYNEKFCWC